MVGRETRGCGGFGRWDVSRYPRLQLGIGASFQRLTLSDLDFRGTSVHDDGHVAYRVAGEQMTGRGSAPGGRLDTRIALLISDNLYLGAEGSFGAVGLGGSVRPKDELALSPSSAIVLSGGALAGAQIAMGEYLLRGEVLVGGRLIGLTAESKHGECVTTTTAWAGQGMVMPRVGIDRWLSPWLTAGLQVGSDPVRQGDVEVGLVFTGHGRAYDAAR